jgi:hypothetical protein
MARLLAGGALGLAWPDFGALGAVSHPSLGLGPVYRGRLSGVSLVVLADQESHDDLFTGRAMTGDAGQRFQAFLAAAGLTKRYAIVRVLPVDTLGLPAAKVRTMVDHPKVLALYQAIVDAIAAASPGLAAIVAVGPNARRLAAAVNQPGRPLVAMKAWKEAGAKADWQQALSALSALHYPTDITPTFSYDGRRGQIARIDLPYGTLRWQASSGDRAARASIAGNPSGDYYKVFMPAWAFALAPRPLTPAEQAVADTLKAAMLEAVAATNVEVDDA